MTPRHRGKGRHMRLIDRTALVTGASRGIGRAMALALATEGADVAVNYLCSETPARQLVKEIEEMGRKALLVQGDVGNYDDAGRMAQEISSAFGHLVILITDSSTKVMTLCSGPSKANKSGANPLASVSAVLSMICEIRCRWSKTI